MYLQEHSLLDGSQDEPSSIKERKNMGLHGIPSWDRPRERLFSLGPRALSVSELLAIVIGSGSPGKSSLNVSHSILSVFHGLRELSEAPAPTLIRVKGCGTAVAARILASLELGRRAWMLPPQENPSITGPEAVARLLLDEVRSARREIFFGLFLNSRNRLIDREIISIGSLNASIVHPREIFRGAVLRSAAALVVCHNHPAGDPHPSREDVEVTHRLFQAGQILGVPLVDHVILGAGHYVSLKDLGLLK